MKLRTLLEASLTRIWRDFNHNEFCIITAWRDQGDVDNKSNFKMIKADIRQYGFGYIRIDGVGQEEHDGEIKAVVEPSLFVKNVKKGGEPLTSSEEFERIMVEIAEKYNQWGIVLSHPDKGTRLIALKDDNGNKISPNVDMEFKTFHPMKIAQFFSRLKGKTFTFEMFKYPNKPNNWMHGMAMEAQGAQNIEKYKNKDKWIEEISKLLSK